MAEPVDLALVAIIRASCLAIDTAMERLGKKGFETANLLSDCRTAISDEWDVEHPDTMQLIDRLDDVLNVIAHEEEEAMDPNATLRTLLQFCHPQPGCTEDQARSGALDAIEALNDWLAKGGALPNALRVVSELIAEGFSTEGECPR